MTDTTTDPRAVDTYAVDFTGSAEVVAPIDVNYGDTVKFHATGRVSSLGVTERFDGGGRHSVTIKVTDLGAVNDVETPAAHRDTGYPKVTLYRFQLVSTRVLYFVLGAATSTAAFIGIEMMTR